MSATATPNPNVTPPTRAALRQHDEVRARLIRVRARVSVGVWLRVRMSMTNLTPNPNQLQLDESREADDEVLMLT